MPLYFWNRNTLMVECRWWLRGLEFRLSCWRPEFKSLSGSDWCPRYCAVPESPVGGGRGSGTVQYLGGEANKNLSPTFWMSYPSKTAHSYYICCSDITGRGPKRQGVHNLMWCPHMLQGCGGALGLEQTGGLSMASRLSHRDLSLGSSALLGICHPWGLQVLCWIRTLVYSTLVDTLILWATCLCSMSYVFVFLFQEYKVIKNSSR